MISDLRRTRDLDRKEKTCQELIRAAIELFAEKGYHASLISDIVTRAGVGQGTFYRHFETKRDLFDAVMTRFGQMLLDEFEPMTANLPRDVEDYRKASREAVLAMASLLQKNRTLVLVLLREGPTVDRDFEQQLDGLFDQFAQLAAFYLDHAIRQGFARPCDTGVVSQALVGMAQRHVSLWLRADSPVIDEMEHLVSELIDFAFSGFGA